LKPDAPENSAMADPKDQQIEDLMAQVAQLTAQIANLQVQAPAPAILPAQAPPQIIVEQQPTVPLPRYDGSKMSVDNFLKEVEEYFVLKGTPDNAKVPLVGRMFDRDSEIKYWWEEVKGTLTWAQFKAEFTAYEGIGQSKDALLKKLFEFRQSLDSPFEPFAWAVVTKYRRIDSQISLEAIRERISSSCVPEIAIHLRNYSATTLRDFIRDKIQIVYDLNLVRKSERKFLLRAKKTDDFTSYNNFLTSGYGKSNPQAQNQTPASQPSTIKTEQGQATGTQYQGPPRGPQQPSHAWLNNVQCFRCLNFGHYSPQCPLPPRPKREPNSQGKD
jgi:hypothetical protein